MGRINKNKNGEYCVQVTLNEKMQVTFLDNNEFEILLKNQNILNEKISALISSNMNIMTSIETIKNNILTILNKMNTLSSKLSDIEVPIKDEYKKTVPVFVEEENNQYAKIKS